MKRILIVSTLAMLTGCSTLLDGVMGHYHNYDPVQYKLTVDLVLASRNIEPSCSNINAARTAANIVKDKAIYYIEYTAGRQYNKKENDLAIKLYNLSADTVKRDSMSLFFCKERAKNLVSAAEVIRSTAGEKKE
tara:strand:- start:93 stop:494 length:402 start_codon:yes stop_codon:yes gene_type:complete